ncbi:hypothetical protein EU527_07765 [Candidatus Thorarchaeota archaeon]|nr:MAG: hypothetical protein EU527_07765 [Candidatus Thorarchaeota archaeon]
MKQNTARVIFVVGLILSSVFLITIGIAVSDEEGNVCPLNIEFSTLLGGNGEDGTGRVAIDSQGNIVLASKSPSTDFPIVNGYQLEINGSDDGVIFKFSPDGQELIFSTFFGGSADEYIYTVAVDSNDDIVVAGTTDSTNLPLKNPIKDNRSTSTREVFLAKFSSDGQELIFSTYICGTSTWVVDLGIDSSDNIILVGSTDIDGLTATEDTYQPNKKNGTDSFVTKISGDGQTIFFSTYLGGNGFESIRSMTLDSVDNIIIAGYTDSDDFPQVSNLCNKSTSTYDNYISKLSADGQELLFSSYYGGNRQWGLTELTVDHNDNIIFIGETNSISFPLVNANQSSYAGGETDGFIAKIDGNDYSIGFSTFFGGSQYDGVHGVVVDNNGDLVICGSTRSSDLPTIDQYQGYNRYIDAFICKLNKNGQFNQFASYYGGSGADYSFGLGLDIRTNSIIMFGHTSSITNFPLVEPYQDSYKGGDFDMFVCKFTVLTSTEANYDIIVIGSIIGIIVVLVVIGIVYGKHRSS